ncbi:MAG: UDP-N-acetylmuramoyl-L-alanyl-D-glutamate--2,6-diaminopimelate ligase [Parcubacteria group bacterium]|jgi:UDP-N-acetylmuramoyl-L-alanyl-D-glutamate--2,6-diaminopimelate ligase
MKKLIPQSLKNIYHLAQAVLANFMYGWPARSATHSVAGGPSKSIKVIGVTGTDGKTTTVQMITRILEEAGHKVAMASTINYRINGREWKNLSHFTTLSSFAVQKFILDAVKERCEYLVLETSSHSLDQFRVWGVPYQTAVITNVTREHLDYHTTMERYRQAKSKLFRKAKIAIVNADMEKPEDFLRFNNEQQIVYTCHPERSGAESKDLIRVDSSVASRGETSLGMTKFIKAENIKLGINKSDFIVDNQKFTLNLIGDFNIENALAAISVGVSEKIELATCARALEKITNVPGRMEYVANERGLNILVDFALTPHALEELYTLLAKIKKPAAKVIAVFGSCGERDRGKRPIMGEIVSRHADLVIVTNDEPYREDPRQIINEIVAGIKNKKENESLFIIPDRREAIRKALQLAQIDDIVAVTGMGEFESMIVGTQKIPWNDRKVILEELQKLQ